MQTHKCLTHIATPIKTICVLLAVMFLAGVAQIIVIQVYWGVSSIFPAPEKPVVDRTEQETQQLDIHNSKKAFTSDGTVYLVSDVFSRNYFKEKKIIVKDRDNKVLFTGKEEDSPYDFILWYPKTNNSRYRSNIDKRYLNELNLIGGEFSRHFVVGTVSVYNKRTGHWFFDTNRRIFKYYSISGEQLGYIGANGYTENRRDAQGFGECEQIVNWVGPDSYDPMMIYQSQYAVYQIDFQNKQVDTLVKTDNDPIRHMMLNNWQNTEEYDYRPSVFILTNSNKLYLHLKNPEQVIEAQLPSDFCYFATPQFAAINDTIFVRLPEFVGHPETRDRDVLSAWYRENRDKAKERKVRLFEVDKAGKFSEKSSFAWVQPASHRNVSHRTTWDKASGFVNSLSSPVPMWLTGHFRKVNSSRQLSVWGRNTINFIRSYSEFKLPVNLCVMTCFATLALLHGWPRRTHIAKLILWVVFVFLFNLPGLLTHLAMNHIPVIRCVHCGKKRGLKQDACCRCNTPLPLPQTKETNLVMPLSA